MRAAPPVALDVPRRGAWAAGRAALSGAAVAALVVWTLQWHESTAAMPLGVAAFVLAAGAVWRGWVPDGGRLQWTGTQWLLDGDAGEVSRVFDLGHWMLLRFDGAGHRAWLAVSGRDAGGAWHGLRTAVMFSPRRVELVDRVDAETSSPTRSRAK